MVGSNGLCADHEVVVAECQLNIALLAQTSLSVNEYAILSLVFVYYFVAAPMLTTLYASTGRAQWRLIWSFIMLQLSHG